MALVPVSKWKNNGAGDNAPPSHRLAKLDHPSSKPLACLRQTLDRAPWHIIFLRDSMDGRFVTEIPQLQSKIKSVVAPRDSLLFGGPFFQGTSVEPTLELASVDGDATAWKLPTFG